MATLYALLGLLFAAFAIFAVIDRSNRKRFGNAAFWSLMALSLLGGSHIGDLANGLIVLGLAGLAGFGALGRGTPPTTSDAEREGFSARLGNRVFLPALVIPVTALIGTVVWNYTPLGQSGLIEAKRETYVFLCLGAILAVLVIWAWLRPPAAAPLQEGSRLIEAIGWAAVLPQMLAALGAVFASVGVGAIVGETARAAIPDGSIFLTVLVFALGMALFTMIMGNAFAAFPVMAAGIGVPLLIRDYGGDPAVIGAIGMLAGFCGTLMTPMAANFNLVPAALLELRDRNAVVKAQVATALPLLGVNILLIYFLAYR
ncbi:DUF979 domain-containing protein [Sphingomonas sp. HF-S3]|uniref:DUF979 domain-containing protein n=1 Tax=Sphingomonas rustica TaxID=3103142 RepID=A0ABV0BAS4_9SPHN